MKSQLIASSLFTATFGVLAQSPVPDCANVAVPTPLLSKAGTVESLAFDGQGRLLFTDLIKGTLTVLAKRDGLPAVLASGIKSPGGIALADNPAEVFVGYGNDLSGLFPTAGKAGVVKVNLQTGVVSPYAQGLSSANGVVRGSDGTIYASNALSSYLGRVLPDGTVEPRWLKQTGNGLALSSDGKTLFLNQSLFPSRVMKVDLATNEVSTVATAPAGQRMSFFDGLATSEDGTLFIAVYLTGQVWSVSPQGQMCVLAKGLSLPTAIAAGSGKAGFASTSLFVSSHGGSIVELPGVLR